MGVSGWYKEEAKITEGGAGHPEMICLGIGGSSL